MIIIAVCYLVLMCGEHINSYSMTPYPSAELIVAIVEHLNVFDAVLVVDRNKREDIHDTVVTLYEQNVYVSVFEWMEEVGADRRPVDDLVEAVASGKQRTLVFFMDSPSTNGFFQQGHDVRELLLRPCLYVWIFFDFYDVDITHLHHFNLSTVCWKTVFVKQLKVSDSESNDFVLSGPYMTQTGDCVITYPLGKWNSQEGFYKIFRRKRPVRDFKNRIFKSAFTDEHPFYAKVDNGPGYEGIEYELSETLQQKLNFKIITVNKTDNEFGRRLKSNGSWTGFMRLLAEGHVMFSLSTLSITNERLMSVDFSSPYLYDKMTFIIISPMLLSRKMVLIKPFSRQVWILLIITFIGCTAALYLITHLLPCKDGVRRAYNIWFLLRTLGQQGTPSIAPARYSIRFFITSWWFFILIFLWSYGSLLKSFMTYPGRRPAVDTVKKLEVALEAGRIEYGTTGGSSYEYFLTNDLSETNPIYGERLRENPDNLVHSVEEGILRVREFNYAFVYMRLVLKWFAASFGYDNFRIAGDVFSNELVAIAIQKCHPCKESFDVIVDRLEETGFFMKWYEDAFEKAKIRAPLPDVKPVRAFSIADIQGALYFLGIGEGISTVVLILEIAVFCAIRKFRRRCRRKQRRKRRKKRI